MLLVIVAALLVFAGVKVRWCMEARSAEDEEQLPQEPIVVSYEPSVQSVALIPSTGELVEGFSLAEGDGELPVMTDLQLGLVNSVLANYEANDRTVGFALLDLTTGRGYAYNVDAEVYGASVIKAPVVLFACEQIDAGNLSLSSVKAFAEDAILWSDNNSYFRLNNVVDARGYGTAFSSWLDELGVDPTLLANESFADCSVRDLMVFWMRAYLYLEESGSPTSTWLAGLLSDTEVSMIRDAVEGTSVLDAPVLASSAVEGLCEALQGGVVYPLASVEAPSASSASPDASSASPVAASASAKPVSEETSSKADSSGEASSVSSESEDLVVYNKAGWIAGDGYNAVNDAGIIVEGDRAYLMCIMTGAPDTDANRTLVVNLARVLWEARGTLQL